MWVALLGCVFLLGLLAGILLCWLLWMQYGGAEMGHCCLCGGIVGTRRRVLLGALWHRDCAARFERLVHPVAWVVTSPLKTRAA